MCDFSSRMYIEMCVFSSVEPAEKVQEAFDLPDGTVPSLMLVLGYPSEKSKPAPLHGQREPIEELVIEL